MNILDFENNKSFESKDSISGPIINQGNLDGKMVLKLKTDFLTVKEIEELVKFIKLKENNFNAFLKSCPDHVNKHYHKVIR